MKIHACRICNNNLRLVYSFGRMPLANVFTAKKMAARYPLELCQCTGCGLIQLGYIVPPGKIFPRYRYVSGASEPLVSYLTTLAAQCIKTCHLTKKSTVLDIGANDGTFLRAFGNRVLRGVGVDPAPVGTYAGVERLFFTKKSALKLRRTYGTFDLVSATHTLANIVDLHDFMEGVSLLLAPMGTFVVEVGCADTVVKEGYFDSVYHEHYSYFSPETLRLLLSMHGFTTSKVERLSMQGGSLRVWAKRGVVKQKTPKKFPQIDARAFKKSMETYNKDLRRTLAPYKGKTVIGFGAPAKAITLVYAAKLALYISAFVDSTTVKQGHVFAGTDIHIYPETYLHTHAADAIILFSWNYAGTILPKIKKLAAGRPAIIIPFPQLNIVQ